MITIHQKAEVKMREEPNFEIFKHNGLLCCVKRINWSGNLNGYVAVTKEHPFYGKEYNEHVVVGDMDSVAFNGNYIGLLCHSLSAEAQTGMLSLDLAINVHGGLTFSRGYLNGIDKDVFGELWWFGFDTAHAGDLRPFQTDIDRQYPCLDDEYRDFEYVKEQTISLAEQLSKYGVSANGS